MKNKPRLSSLAFLGFSINMALENGYANAISFDDVYTSLNNKTLLEDLETKIPDFFDFSLYPKGSEENQYINEVLDYIAGGLQGRERRKVGIEKSGLNLLLAYILEAMQQKDWV